MSNILSVYGLKSSTAENYSMHRVLGQSGSIGSIFIGNLDAAENINLLRKNNIGAVISVIDISVKVDPSIKKLQIFAEDAEDFPLSKYFGQTYRFIDEQKEKTNILVHCYAGISRSTTIVLAYLIMKYGWSLNFSLKHVRSSRTRASPNSGFLEQLSELEQRTQKTNINANSTLNLSQSQSSLDFNTNTYKSKPKIIESFLGSPSQVSNTVSRFEKLHAFTANDRFYDLNEKLSKFQKNQKKENTLNFLFTSLTTSKKINQSTSTILQSNINTSPFTLNNHIRSTFLNSEIPTTTDDNRTNLTFLKQQRTQFQQSLDKKSKSYLSTRSNSIFNV